MRYTSVLDFFSHFIARFFRPSLDPLKTTHEEKDTEDRWLTITGESGLEISLTDIPEKFRTPRVVGEWLSHDWGRLHSMPSEYTSKKFVKEILKHIRGAFSVSLSLEELELEAEALSQIKAGLGRGPRKLKVSKEQIQECCDRMTLSEMSSHLGASVQAICYALKRYGITRRDGRSFSMSAL